VNTVIETINERKMAPEPIPPIKFLESPFPKKVMYRNPTSGNKGMSETNFSM
jgi:hypothetical protein